MSATGKQQSKTRSRGVQESVEGEVAVVVVLVLVLVVDHWRNLFQSSNLTY